MTYINNGDGVVEKVVGFFNQTIRHEFEEKPRISHPLKRQSSIPRQFRPLDESEYVFVDKLESKSDVSYELMHFS